MTYDDFIYRDAEAHFVDEEGACDCCGEWLDEDADDVGVDRELDREFE